MTDEDDRDPVEELAECFLDSVRRGENPRVEDYAEAHPHLAERIHDLFPALLTLEEHAPGVDPRRAAASVAERRLPESLGDYRILREIGRGGMGVVYEAEQTSLGRRVALKVLAPGFVGDEAHLERFRQEARAAARLHHTNIVPIFGVGEDCGIHYYAMQYIRGQTLAEVLLAVRQLRGRGEQNGGDAATDTMASAASGLLSGSFARGPEAESTYPDAQGVNGDVALPAVPGQPPRGASSDMAYHRSVARIGLQVAEALAYAHAEGVLHRDIKPSNLLLDLRGTVWITDFGLAKAGESADLTASGHVVGTLRYLAPERFRGEEDERGDIYSLGATLYELLTLRPTHEGADQVKLLRDLASREPPRPRSIDPRIPRDMETIVLKATARLPRDRYNQAEDLAADLRRFLNHEPVSARRATTAERFWRWCQRNPVVAFLAAGVAALSITLAVGGWISARQLRDERDTAFQSLVAAKLEEGRAWRRSGAAGHRTSALKALREAAAGGAVLEARNEIIAALALCDLTVEDEWEMPPGGSFPDTHLERWVNQDAVGLSVSSEGHGGAPTIVFKGGASTGASLIKFSPSSRFLAALHGARGRVAVWDIDRGELILELPASSRGFPLSFRPDETALAAPGLDGSVEIRALPRGDVLQRLPGPTVCRDLAHDPEGHRLAVVSAGADSHVVRILDLPSGGVSARLHHPEMVVEVAWHPEGRLLAAACFDFKVYVWEAATGRRLHALAGHSAESVKVAFSPGGDLLASSGWDERTYLWDPLTGAALTVARGVLTSFNRSGDRLGFKLGNQRCGIWRVTGNAEQRLLRAPGARPEKRPNSIAISPDGRWLAAACGPWGVRLWSTSAPYRWTDLPGAIEDVIFLPDGALLTSGSAGVHRWPLETGGTGEWTVGPPRETGIRGWRFAIDQAARRLAIIAGPRIEVWDLAASKRLQTFEHHGVHRVQLGASGKKAVTCTWQGAGVRVWDVAAGRLEKEIEAGSALARFSPDERWLAVGTETAFSLHEAGSWEVRFRIDRTSVGNAPGHLAFTADSQFVAFSESAGRLTLRQVESGAEVARLESPALEVVGWTVFSPDGRLAAWASRGELLVRLWDLGLIRRELADLGLDWDPPLPAPPAPPPPPRPPRVDLGGLAPSTAPQGPRRFADLELLETHTRRIALDPSSGAYADRARAHLRVGAIDEAIADLELAIAASTAPEELLEQRATLLAKAERLPEALADYDRLVLLRRQRGGEDASPSGASELERALQARAEVERRIPRGEPAKE